MNIVLTIDGPAGSGKSTVARKLAKRLAFIHLNSGVLYRALADEALKAGLSLDDEKNLASFASKLKFDFLLTKDNETQTLVNKSEIGTSLTSLDVAKGASKVAVHSAVRDIFLEVQRTVAKNSSLVVEGRDAGTIVFPDAFKKFYLDASPEIRAKRRYEELVAKGEDVSLSEITSQMNERDFQDSTREVAPSVCADDAIVVDTSFSGIDEVVEQIVTLVGDL